MGLSKPVEDYESVRTWAKGLREQWGSDALAQDREKLRNLQAFCDFMGKDPDALVAFCFLRRKSTGERFGSVKRRAQVAAKLAEFRAALELPASEGRRSQNDVLSFLIHNGVLIHMGVG
jgi:hypothetical protein